MLARGTKTAFTALAALTLATGCQQKPDMPWTSEVEDTVFEVRVAYENKSSGGNSSGSSSGHNTLTERIINVSSKEIVVEYESIPSPKRYVDEQPNLIDWEFPATISLLASGEFILQNTEEIAARNAEWRQAAGFPDDACGLWYFTWNAFKVECNPDTVIQSLEAFVLFNDYMDENRKIEEPGTLEPSILTLVASSPLTFQAKFDLDPEIIREERAQQDVIVAQMMQRETVTLEDALQERNSEQISGTLTTVWELDDLGRVVKRTRNSIVTIELESGERETLTQKKTTTRTLQAD